MTRWIPLALLLALVGAGCTGGTVHVYGRGETKRRDDVRRPVCCVEGDDDRLDEPAPRSIDVTTRRTTRVIDRRICIAE